MRAGKLLVLLLLLDALGCSRHGSLDNQTQIDAATLAIRRGELDAARTIADAGLATARRQPDSQWAWRFTLLAGEVRLRRHDLSEAQPFLTAEPPATQEFAFVRARQAFLRGFSQLLAGDRRMAAGTIARARTLIPGDSSAAVRDLRSDIDLYDGIIALQLGEFDRGDSLLNELLARSAAGGERYYQAAALLDLGYGQLVRKRYDAALTQFERVLSFNDQNGTTVYADALNNAGICYSRLGQFDRAASAQRRAVERQQRGPRREYEQALGQLGTTYLDAGNAHDGVEYLRQALETATAAGLKSDAALWAGNLAAASIASGGLDEAERFNDEARRLKLAAGSGEAVYNTLRAADIAARRGQTAEAARLFTEAMTTAPANPSAQWSAHEGLAQLAIAAGRPAQAMPHFAAALETVEKTRSDLMRTDYKLSYLTRLIGFYRSYVDALVDQGQIERALEIADSSRGRVLAERQGVATPSAGRPGELRRRAAQSHAVLLSYWLAPRRSYMWIVTPARVQIVTLPPASELDALVRQHQSAIDNIFADPLAPSSPAASAGERLARLLVEPARALVPSGGRMIVVPDGSLYALNFETLPVAGAGPDAGRHYLIEDAEIAVAPSLAMLADGPAEPAPSSRSLLIIGDATPRPPDYPALKFAAAEMNNVSRHFPADRVTSLAGVRAVPAAYRTAMPDRFTHVHFTAHATASVDSPLDSAVILSGPDSSFKLYARDVAAMPLHAELVTVSACRSAGGRTYSGEGLVGFAWAFLRGGARRVIAGLWDVDDQSTAALMDALYGGLADGEPAGRALRDAKLAQLRRGGPAAKPYYWAPFELFTLTP